MVATEGSEKMTQVQMKQAVSKVIDGLTALAVSKYSQPKGNRENIAPGEYQIDETVRVVGTVIVGKDFDKANIASLPLMKLVLKLASQVSDENLAKMISPEALAKVSDKEVKEFSERIQSEWAKLAKSVTQKYKGQVTSKLVFTKA